MATRPQELPGLFPSEQTDPIFGNDPMSGLMGNPGMGAEQGIIGDLYPTETDEYDKILRWAQDAFTAADSAREPYAERWRRYYKLYRSYMRRKPGDWHSRVFVPISFWVIETIVPRMVAQLPKFFTEPVGPEDVFAAQKMEELMGWAQEESELYMELVKAYKSSLKYGTGLLKTFHRLDKRVARKIQPLTAPLMQTFERPVTDVYGQTMMDMDGTPIIERYEDVVGEIPAGMSAQKYQYTSYDGPAAECVDIFNFWCAPEAQDLDTARYVIHRSYKELSHIQKLVEEGVYRWPEGMEPEEVSDVTDDPHLLRLDSIGLGVGQGSDPTRRPVELLEFWTDDGRVITMANRKAVIRVQENPFDHSEKPFVRFVDYLQEHEFWGVGEIEPLEGLQDLQNALVNSRIDNVRLVLNAMFAVNTDNVVDLADLEMRPGGVVRLKGDFDPRQVIQRIELGDVTSSAFTEAESNERTVEKVSGVSGYQMGMDSPSMNDTATGVAIIQEQGASRFGLKSRLSELMALKRLGRHYGSILQQFTTEERLVRMYGPDGQMMFQTFTPDSIQGSLDYDVEAGSPTQTQTVRQQTAQQLYDLIQGAVMQGMAPPEAATAALDNLLESMNIKDKQRYLMGVQTQPMAPQLPPGQPQPGPQGVPQEMPMQGMNPGNPAEGTFGQQNAARMNQSIQQSYDSAAWQ